MDHHGILGAPERDNLIAWFRRLIVVAVAVHPPLTAARTIPVDFNVGINIFGPVGRSIPFFSQEKVQDRNFGDFPRQQKVAITFS